MVSWASAMRAASSARERTWPFQSLRWKSTATSSSRAAGSSSFHAAR